MRKRRKKRSDLKRAMYFIIVLLIISVLAYFALYDVTFTGFVIYSFENETQFSNGTYNNTEWSVDHVQLAGVNTSGTYSCDIFDAGGVAVWNNVSWTESVISDGLILFVVDNGEEIWKSTDGENWTSANEDYGGGNADDLRKDSDDNLYIIQNRDVWKSTDSGLNWVKVNDDYGGGDAEILVVDSDDNLYIFDTGEDVWKSTDSGGNWTQLVDDLNGGNGNVAGADVDGDDSLFVVDNSEAVWKSTDNGGNWTEVSDDYGGGNADDLKIDSNDNLYIVQNRDVWKSTDFGGNWTLVNDDYGGGNAEVLMIDNDDNLYIFDAGEDVWKSTDFGGNWTQLVNNFNGGNGDIAGAVSSTFSNDLTFEFRACDSSDCSGSDFSGTYTDPSGADLSLSNTQYFQCKAIFSTDESSSSSFLYSIVLDYDLISAPVVNLISPGDEEVSSNENVSFTYNVSSLGDISSCSFVLDGTVNETDNSITKDVDQTFDKTLSNGEYNWSVNCSDEYGQGGSSSTWDLTINFTPTPTLDNFPTITLVSPVDANVTTSQNVDFVCSVSDDLQISNISLYWNYSGSWSLSESSDVSGTDAQNTFEKTDLDNGVILWNCFGCDNNSQCDWGDSNWTVTVNYTEATAPTGGSDEETPVVGGVSGDVTGGRGDSSDEEELFGGEAIESAGESEFLEVTERGALGNFLTGLVTLGTNVGNFAINNIFSVAMLLVSLTGALWIVYFLGKKLQEGT